MKIILASGSPRRRELLSGIEADFEVLPAGIEESYPAELPEELIPEYLAQKKAEHVVELLRKQQKNMDNLVVLAADTIVVVNGEVLGKPEDEKAAFDMLQKIAGRAHQVISGVCLKTETQTVAFHEVTKVYFHHLSDDEILHYIKHYKPFDKAGAYAIQEWIGMIGIKYIEGDYYNVVGLPVNRVYQELKKMKN